MVDAASSPISDSLLARVLERLEVAGRDPTMTTLRSIYASWCGRVPFDNVRKLIHLRDGEAAPLPGANADDYLENWLRHGTGGTCWAGSNALFSVLGALGFRVDRCVATMLVAPDLPPNHGSVRVQLDGRHYLVDTSILFGEPLRLTEGGETQIAHPAWGVQGMQRSGLWHLRWRPLHKTDGFECRFDRFGADADEYRRRYEDTRGWSPFNYQVTARRNRGDEVIGLAFGHAVTLRPDGSVESRPIDDGERRRMLTGDFGMSEEVVARLPEDRPTPPPPGSKTAAAQAGL